MKEGKAEFYTSELFQDIPTTVGCLWKNIDRSILYTNIYLCIILIHKDKKPLKVACQASANG